MYENFYGLSELPFELTANPKYLFLAAKHREALSILQYGLLSAKSLTVLIGEAGTGKTTLIRAALESERCSHIRCIYLNNPALRTDDFVRLLALKFDLGSESGASKALFLERLELLLRDRQARGETTALVIDEAQSLSVELLEEIRLLANIETSTAKLLPLVLAGQPELGARLEDPSLRQLKQRVTLRCQIEPFDVTDTAAYMASRLSTAGGVPSRVFSQEAVRLIHDYSRGIPRTINVICDNALVSGMALGRHYVDRAIVREVCRDLRLKSGREPDRELGREPGRARGREPESDAVEHDQTAEVREEGTPARNPAEGASSSRRSTLGLGAPAGSPSGAGRASGRAAGRMIPE